MRPGKAAGLGRESHPCQPWSSPSHTKRWFDIMVTAYEQLIDNIKSNFILADTIPPYFVRVEEQNKLRQRKQFDLH